MAYRQLSSEERYTIAALRWQRWNHAEIARHLGRHRSTICREVQRNSARLDGSYRAQKAIERTNGRRSRSRRNRHFRQSDYALVERQLKEAWSPEQISGRLRLTSSCARSRSLPATSKIPPQRIHSRRERLDAFGLLMNGCSGHFDPPQAKPDSNFEWPTVA